MSERSVVTRRDHAFFAHPETGLRLAVDNHYYAHPGCRWPLDEYEVVDLDELEVCKSVYVTFNAYDDKHTTTFYVERPEDAPLLIESLPENAKVNLEIDPEYFQGLLEQAKANA